MSVILLFFLLFFVSTNSSVAVQYNVTNQSSSGEINDIINSMNDSDILFFEDGVYYNNRYKQK